MVVLEFVYGNFAVPLGLVKLITPVCTTTPLSSASRACQSANLKQPRLVYSLRLPPLRYLVRNRCNCCLTI